MAFDPEPGLVIRYDFLWREQADKGQEHGSKDRPCTIVLSTQEREDGGRLVLLAPITHSEPGRGESAVEIPMRVARHLGLDDDRSFVKTHEVNTVYWPKDRLPFGVIPENKDQWSMGMLPNPLSKKVFDQVRERSNERSLENVRRDMLEDYRDIGYSNAPDSGNDDGRGR